MSWMSGQGTLKIEVSAIRSAFVELGSQVLGGKISASQYLRYHTNFVKSISDSFMAKLFA